MTTAKKRHAKVHRKRHEPAAATAAPTTVGVEPPAQEEPPVAAFLEPERRHERISEAAYFIAEQRDFTPGHELDDWLAAEHEIDKSIAAEPTGCGS